MRDGTQTDGNKGVTVVVPTLNRGQYLRDCLLDLIEQDYHPLEILVVDQSANEDEEVLRLSRMWPNIIRFHRVPFRGLPHARNYGWQNARYDMIVFVDDDIRCDRTLVKEHAKTLTRPGVGVVAGAVDSPGVVSSNPVATGKFCSWFAIPVGGFSAEGEFEVEHAPGGNFAVLRKVLEDVGGFDEQLANGAALYEETEFCLRARKHGYKVWFNGRARVVHLGAPTGGCRPVSVSDDVQGFAHNRAVLIRRHVSVLQRPVAVARLTASILAHAWRHRNARSMLDGIIGAVAGWKNGGRAPRCTQWRTHRE